MKIRTGYCVECRQKDFAENLEDILMYAYTQGFKQPVCIKGQIHRECRTQHFDKNIRCPNCLRGDYPHHKELSPTP